MEKNIHEFNSMFNSSMENPPTLEKYVKQAKSEICQVRTDTEDQTHQNQKEVEEDAKSVKEKISIGEKTMQELSVLVTQAQNAKRELKEQKTSTEKAAKRFESQIKFKQLNKRVNYPNNHSVSPNSSINEKDLEQRIFDRLQSSDKYEENANITVIQCIRRIKKEINDESVTKKNCLKNMASKKEKEIETKGNKIQSQINEYLKSLKAKTEEAEMYKATINDSKEAAIKEVKEAVNTAFKMYIENNDFNTSI